MNISRYFLLIFLAVWCVSLRAQELTEVQDSVAQSATGSLRQHVPFFQRKFFREGFLGRVIKSFDDDDTLYLAQSHYNWSVLGSVDLQTQMHALVTPDGTFRATPHQTLSVSPHFGWRWLVLGYGINLTGNNSRLSTTKLSFYPRPFGGDLCYQRNKGDFFHNGRLVPGCSSTLITLHPFYVFNRRRFAYSAGLAQGSPQIQSAGSWFLGLRYDYQKTCFGNDDPSNGLTLLTYHDLQAHCLAVTTGYAYNWVFAPQWLLTAGLQPSLGVSLYREGDARNLTARGANSTTVLRLGVVWTDGKRFAGASAVSHNYMLWTPHLRQFDCLSYFSVYAGFKFGLRKQYRNHR